MKLNKVVTGISALTLSALLLTACSAKSGTKDTTDSKEKSSKVEKKEVKEAKKTAGAPLKDGTYKLAETGYSNGYKVEMSMTVKDGKITDTTYDNVNKDGKSKKDDTKYEEQMKQVNKIGPKEYIPQLNDSFKKNGENISAIETVSGATGSSISFKNYAQQLIQAAQAGNTEEIKIDNTAKYKDGTYTLDEKNDSNGYHVAMSITIKDGKVSDVKYDNVDKNGKSKKDDAKYEEEMMKVNKIGPKEYMPKFEENFKKAMASKEGLEGFEIVSGATHSANSFLIYAAQLLNAAQKGDTAKIEVDNNVFAE